MSPPVDSELSPLQAMLGQLSPRGVPGSPALFAQGALCALAGSFFGHCAGGEQAGVFAIFLAAAPLAGAFDALISENRRAIWEAGEPSGRVNRRTAAGLLSLFLGVFCSFFATAVFLGAARTSHTFAFALASAGLSDDTLASRTFGSLQGLWAHNAMVLVALGLLAAIYRSYGALLALLWNAAVWAVVLAALLERGLSGEGPHSPLALLVAVLAVLPHLVLEALAYVLACLAAIFASKALLKYGPGDARFRRVLGTCGRMVALAASVLLVAAALESRWAPAALRTAASMRERPSDAPPAAPSVAMDGRTGEARRGSAQLR